MKITIDDYKKLNKTLIKDMNEHDKILVNAFAKLITEKCITTINFINKVNDLDNEFIKDNIKFTIIHNVLSACSEYDIDKMMLIIEDFKKRLCEFEKDMNQACHNN